MVFSIKHLSPGKFSEPIGEMLLFWVNLAFEDGVVSLAFALLTPVGVSDLTFLSSGVL